MAREPVRQNGRDAVKADTLIEKAYGALKNDIIRGRHRPRRSFGLSISSVSMVSAGAHCARH